VNGTKTSDKSKKMAQIDRFQASKKEGENVRAGKEPFNHRELKKLKVTDEFRTQELYIFRRHGQKLEGLVHPPRGYTRQGQKVIPVQKPDGDTVLIPGNKHLQRLILKYRLIGKWVVIEYVGDKWTYARHKMKIYAIYQSSLQGRSKASPAMQQVFVDAGKKQKKAI